MPDYVFDRYRQRYAIEVQEDRDQSFCVKIKDGDEYVGQMLCSFCPASVMILEDLFICNGVETYENWGAGRKICRTIPEFLSDLLRWRSDNAAMNYRNRGLGSALLGLLFDLARNREVKTIFGSLVKKDILRNPCLQRGYMNRGFTGTGQFEGCILDAETYIRFEVPYK